MAGRRLTRQFPVRMSEAGYRRLRRFAEDTGLEEGDALSFLFEHLDGTDAAGLDHRLRQYGAKLTRAERETG
ncbi:hypothetical protein JSE7799_00757 [Jannaschia seosinensis]|uniref:Uncharacterized protein n=1 Tax=Jannaschia seosinensis TaxID=313367 RepID=A0A0M7B8C3_9RHOB|nr:hypothetical protein [Jannaschia seosinensis]CUH26874.1 hypothetical protein JSE7799_00757 [Jannaschia seosinensis]